MAPRHLSGFTAVPNAILDNLPAYSDSELRLLLTVARNTAGWRDGVGRRTKVWLSHRRLQAATGRAGEAVSNALASLVSRRILIAESEDGAPLETPKKRRAHRGRIYYRLAAEYQGTATSASRIRQAKTIKQRDKEIEFSIPGDTSSSEIGVAPEADGIQPRLTQTEISKMADSSTAHSSSVRPGDAQSFLQVFAASYREAFPEEAVPEISDDDRALLERRLGNSPPEELARWLPAFFRCEFGFVRRRRYSLASFLRCVHVLRAQGVKNSLMPHG